MKKKKKETEFFIPSLDNSPLPLPFFFLFLSEDQSSRINHPTVVFERCFNLLPEIRGK